MGESIGAEEPWEKVTDGESGPTLDLVLPCCDRGRIDSRRIHDPLDEKESRESSAMVGAGKSPVRMND